MKSLFSKLELSSSQSSLESISLAAPAKAAQSADRPIRDTRDTGSRQEQPALPTVINDIFNVTAVINDAVNVPVVIEKVLNVESSSNVTTRRIQRVDEPPLDTVSETPKPLDDIKENPKCIDAFANSRFGTNLDISIIAHCPKTQKLLDEKKVAWGTQFELARGVSAGSWTWSDVQSKIDQFTGDNATAASKVPSIMLSRSVAASDNSLWKELDREQAAIQENQGRGLGLMGDWQGSTDWHGGRIQQIGRVLKLDDSFKIVLEPCESRRSYRFARFYGSRRFLNLGIPDEILKTENDKVKAYLSHKFIICGRTFVAFHAKDSHVYMVETDEDFERSPPDQREDWCGDQFRLSFRDFINWHNPLDQPKNYKQVISKYATRFALGLSNSVPILEFKEENIMFIDDITASDWPIWKEDPPADKLMTDGCGLINHAALHQIVKRLGYENVPAAIQGRIDGSKGLWILHPSDRSPEPKIWIRTSQNKIKNRSFDRAHRIFDLLEPSRASAPISLTKQSIVNLFCNGISQESLVNMMRDGLEQEVAPLLDWDKPNAMVYLWDVLNKTSGISGSRAKRLSVSLNRALGLEHREWGHTAISADIEEIVKPDDILSATLTRRNMHSGEPESFSEFAMELIQAGFNPAENRPLYEKIRYVVSETIKSNVEKFRIPIEESLGAFIVPDPLGILEEGEIYYRFSTPRCDPRTSMQVHVLEGDVVLGRYPIRLPSDMQKARAVNRRELDRWPDVVIVSTKGKRSLASLLADGDMDGDELIVIYDQAIVAAFQNKPFTSAPANFYEDNFTRSVEKVEQFCDRAALISERKAHEAFQLVLIASLAENNVGIYSSLHENAIIKYGYGDPISIRLAYIFATLLDASKTGYVSKPGLLESDSRKFGTFSNMMTSGPVSQDILALLKAAGEAKGVELLGRYKAIQWARTIDPHLKHPYATAIDYAIKAKEKGISLFEDELRRIRAHVDSAYNMWREACDKSRAVKDQFSPTKSNKKPFASKKAKAQVEAEKLAASQAYAQPIEDIVLTTNLEQVKASFAYTLSPYFGFSVAFQNCLLIKAVNSPGGLAPNLRIFDEAKVVSASFMRALRSCESEAHN
ncbi:hypothetical protein BDN70DRAFT_692461 [Pholiota conissans]|uniref:RNA-dependent RNA polymerase n=1 Tax=Pholiota conissans TaxID=109636 RepID=A0A9P6CTI5_9AGAR|nr:hypothetical protein BDN70DRAFT_692461 [Pholiota conissans]